MSSADDPRPVDAIPPAIATPGPVATATSAPPTYVPESDSPYGENLRLRARLDRVLIVLTVGFAFVLASATIRNSDIWVHLASGRYLVWTAGDFATEPFAQTSAGAATAHPSWLFDVVSYLVYAASDGVGLGIFKALLVALLAAALLWAGWPGGGWWVPVLFTTLALLACAPRLQLQPLLASLILLVLTLGYLERRTSAAAADSWLSYWPLYLHFALWANLDTWFALGPLALACYWLGGKLPGGRSAGARVPAAAVAVGFLVCLANPHLYRVFNVPAELALAAANPALAADPVIAPLFLAPWQPGFYATAQGQSVAGLGLAALVVVGIPALVLDRTGRRWARLLVVAGLVALGLYRVRELPLLAAALGVLAPRALRGIADARFAGLPGSELRLRQAVTGRFGTVVAGLALLALAALGRLHPGAPEPRAWAVEADPSLVRVAEELATWHATGKLDGAARGFNFSPEVANYLAWFGPAEKGFFDSRLEVSAPAATDFVAVRGALTGLGPAVGGPGATGKVVREPGLPPDWREVLRRRGVDHLILADRDRFWVQAALAGMVADPQRAGEWAVLLQAGRVLVLGWNDPAAKGPRRWHDTDLNYQGLHPTEEQKAPHGPQRPADEPSWWTAVLPAASEPSLDRDEAMLHLVLFDAERLPTALADVRQWELVLAAGVVGEAAAGAGVAGPLAAALRGGWLGALPKTQQESTSGAAQFALHLRSGYLFVRDDAPPGHLWAAVRACRRALAADPRDADAYLLLGEAYCRLIWNTPVRFWGGRHPLLSQYYRQQAISTLHQAARLRPGLEQPHALLVALYREIGYVDLALPHAREHLKAARARGPLPGEPPAQFAERVRRLQKAADQLELDVRDRKNTYERQKEGLNKSKRALLLEKLGLAAEALDALLDSDLAAFGKEGLLTELELLLSAGRAEEAREWFEPTHQQLLDDFDYYWIKARIAAAAGDYEGADADLHKLVPLAEAVPELRNAAVDLEKAVALAVGSSLLGGAYEAMAPSPFMRINFGTRAPWVRMHQLAVRLRQAAQIEVLRGAVALEAGDVVRAGQHLRRALVLTSHDRESSSALGPDWSLHPVATHLLGLLTAPPKG
jgi:hypothetical protein